MPTPTTKRAPKAAGTAQRSRNMAKEDGMFGEPAPAKRTRKAADPTPVEPAKPATGPRGELLDRKGAILDEPVGYIVVLPFRKFETAKAGPEVGQLGTEPKWVTRCTAHGTFTPAANGTEAERQGARKARQTWCKACAKAAAKT